MTSNQFSNYRKAKNKHCEYTADLEQHRSELHQSTLNTDLFFNQYIGKIFGDLQQFDLFSLAYFIIKIQHIIHIQNTY